jgi:acyl-CoA synthetase (AMP-forming)/AMP-acid ligase II
MGNSTLVQLLRDRALEQSDSHAYTFLADGNKETGRLTYGELDRQARAIAAQLQSLNAKGERALILYPAGLEVIAAFCGCLYAGVIAIPAPPPEAGRLKRTLPRLQAIIKDAQASLVLTTAGILEIVSEVRVDFPELQTMRWIDTEKVDLELAEAWEDPNVDQDILAYLQYTSGSTSTPKGVMLSHYNLMHHAAYLKQACGYESHSVTVTWMPYFHDYGLVEGLMVPLYNCTPCYVMSPFSFIKRPLVWLQAIANYQGTHSQAPNFAYDQCIRRIKPAQMANLDLSCWEAAGNAAEPINPKVMREFFEKFAPCGFRWEAFAPAYGLAEDTLLVSTKPKLTEPVFCHVSTVAIEKDQIIPVKPDDEGVRTFPSCGRLVCETKVAIVNPDKLTRCTGDRVGEIWVSDPSVAQGYWQRTTETQETFKAYLADTGEGPFLRTGDLGFIKDGELYITGRIKDLIIIRGTNHYPQDIEWTTQQVNPAFRPDYGAAFSINANGDEKLVVVQEVERGNEGFDTQTAIADIRQEIAEQHELQTHAIVLVKRGNILKTASGKIQRRACRASFLAGELGVIDDWSEDPKLTAAFRRLRQEVDSLEEKLHTA